MVALRPLVAVHVGNGEPTQREIEFPDPFRHHARHGGRHLRADSQPAAAPILKMIGLFAGQFLAAFGRVKIERLQHGAAVLLKTGLVQGAPDAVKKAVARPHLLGEKVPRALVRQYRQFGCFHIIASFFQIDNSL